MKKLLLLFSILITSVPAFVSAEADIPKPESKPDVSLSGPVAAPAAQAAQKMTRKKKYAKKIPYEGSTRNPLGMTEEEQQIMEANNKKDGYHSTRQKPKTRNSASRS